MASFEAVSVQKTQDYGGITASGGGDAEHDESAIQALNEHDIALRQAIDLRSAIGRARELTPPKQNDKIEVGHRVQLFFGGDPTDMAFATIVTPINTIVLKDLEREGRKLFDGGTEILASSESPLGKSLIGHRNGDAVSAEFEGVKIKHTVRVSIGEIGTAQIF